MIPKVIHYCWFGGKSKSRLIRECIKSWYGHLPEYEIIEWNERNSDLSHPFVKAAYNLKKWAFVSDYIRLKVLYDSGGIYLDTDMMVIQTFDSLLENKCFFGAEDLNFISCGIIGAEKKNDFIINCLIQYETISINRDSNWDLITMPFLITKAFREHFNFKKGFDKKVKFEDIVIYQTEWFYPLPNKMKKDFLNYKNYITSNTLAVHLWNASWVEYDEFYYIKNKLFLKAIIKILKNFFSQMRFDKLYLKKVLKAFYNAMNTNF